MSSDILLPGLDAANPLAFLAALGVLRVLADALDAREIRMGWSIVDGVWHPRLAGDHIGEPQRVLDVLDAELTRHTAADVPAADDLTLTPAEFAHYAAQSVGSSGPTRRRGVDFAAALGTEAFADDRGRISDTALRTMSGAGHQHFLKSIRTLMGCTAPDHLRKALFEPWSRADEGPSMRWDPEDDRRYALRWKDPSGDQIRTERGANRLAIEGLRLLTTAVVGSRLLTTGFTGKDSRHTFWMWPVWRPALPVDVVRSLLTDEDLHRCHDTEARLRLRQRGVATVFRSQRLTVGKFRNFTPGQAIA